MDSVYSTSSLVGLVSSNRRWHRPLFSAARPKFKQMDLACPICKYPLGSGGKRVITRPSFLFVRRSSAMILLIKFGAGVYSLILIFAAPFALFKQDNLQS